MSENVIRAVNAGIFLVQTAVSVNQILSERMETLVGWTVFDIQDMDLATALIYSGIVRKAQLES